MMIEPSVYHGIDVFVVHNHHETLGTFETLDKAVVYIGQMKLRREVLLG